MWSYTQLPPSLESTRPTLSSPNLYSRSVKIKWEHKHNFYYVLDIYGIRCISFNVYFRYFYRSYKSLKYGSWIVHLYQHFRLKHFATNNDCGLRQLTEIKFQILKVDLIWNLVTINISILNWLCYSIFRCIWIWSTLIEKC